MKFYKLVVSISSNVSHSRYTFYTYGATIIGALANIQKMFPAHDYLITLLDWRVIRPDNKTDLVFTEFVKTTDGKEE